MISLFDDSPVLEDNDRIRHAYRRKSVRHEYHGLVLGQASKPGIEGRLSTCVHCGCRFVKRKNLRFTHECAGNCQVLPLATQDRVVAQSKSLNHLFRTALSGSIDDFLAVFYKYPIAATNTVRGGDVESREILENDAYARLETLDVVVSVVSYIEPYGSMGRILESCQQRPIKH